MRPRGRIVHLAHHAKPRDRIELPNPLDHHRVNTDHCARRTPARLPESQFSVRRRALEIFTCRQLRHILGSQAWRQEPQAQ